MWIIFLVLSLDHRLKCFVALVDSKTTPCTGLFFPFGNGARGNNYQSRDEEHVCFPRNVFRVLTRQYKLTVPLWLSVLADSGKICANTGLVKGRDFLLWHSGTYPGPRGFVDFSPHDRAARSREALLDSPFAASRKEEKSRKTSRTRVNGRLFIMEGYLLWKVISLLLA